MKARLAAMEEEAQKLKDEANAIGDDMNTGDGAGAGATDADKAEARAFLQRGTDCEVGLGDYEEEPPGVNQGFASCCCSSPVRRADSVYVDNVSDQVFHQVGLRSMMLAENTEVNLGVVP